jgi:hypothetical protein
MWFIFSELTSRDWRFVYRLEFLGAEMDVSDWFLCGLDWRRLPPKAFWRFVSKKRKSRQTAASRRELVMRSARWEYVYHLITQLSRRKTGASGWKE